jgi:NAD(P)H-flavin reductase
MLPLLMRASDFVWRAYVESLIEASSPIEPQHLLQGVGFINEAFIKAHMHPPSDDLLIVICGPYPMCMALKKLLPACGYAPEMFFSYM